MINSRVKRRSYEVVFCQILFVLHMNKKAIWVAIMNKYSKCATRKYIQGDQNHPLQPNQLLDFEAGIASFRRYKMIPSGEIIQMIN